MMLEMLIKDPHIYHVGLTFHWAQLERNMAHGLRPKVHEAFLGLVHC